MKVLRFTGLNKILLIIFIFGIFLRFYQLGDVPGSLEWDEVSIGYNAYSVLTTGKDEFGSILPMTFRSLSDYKQPVYIYLDILPVSLFGLNAYAVRFPSAFFGSMTILVVFLLVKEIFRKYKYSNQLSIVSMLSFAISPWHIQFSRGAFEANVALSFIILATWLFLRGIRLQKVWYLFVSVIIFILSTYTYLSPKIFVPLLCIGLFVFGKQFLLQRKFTTIVLAVILFIGIFLWLLNPTSMTRGQGVLFTTNQTELLSNSIQQLHLDTLNNDIVGTFVHNRRIIYTFQFVSNYLSHYNPVWLFITGDVIGRHHAPGMGNLYLFSLPFILFGIFFLLTRFFKQSLLVFFWFLLAAFPASPTSEAPHSIRSLVFLPTWQIFEAAGLLYIFIILKKNVWKYVFIAVIGLGYTLNFVYFAHQYFVHTNVDYQREWIFGYKEAIMDMQKDKRYIFSDNFEQPYIFYLFYNKYDPSTYLRNGGSNRLSSKCYSIDSAYFGNCKDILRKGDYYLSIKNEQVDNMKFLKSINYSDGTPAVKIHQYE